MRKSFKLVVLGQALLAVIALAACGDDGPTVIPPSIDGGDITLPPEICDISKQNCATGTDKCTVALDDNNAQAPWSTVCRPEGAITLGEMCVRDAEGAVGVGRDNCAENLYCTAFGTLSGDVTPASRRCRRFCRANSVCAPDVEFCRPLTSLVNVVDGICIPKCTPFGTTECTSTAWCAPIADIDLNTSGECERVGNVATGGDCDSEMMKDCVSGNACITYANAPGVATCRKVCDKAGLVSACSAGEVCNDVRGFPTEYGVCDPAPDAGPAAMLQVAPRRQPDGR